MNTYSANSIHITGQISEDTCSRQNTNLQCQSLNDIHHKIDTMNISSQDLKIYTQQNDVVEVHVEMQQNSHALIIANYH